MADTGKTIGLIKALASVDPEAIKSSVDDWLDDHPEATTTVEDGAITKAKLDSSLQQTVDDVGDLKSATKAKVTVNSGYVIAYTSGNLIANDYWRYAEFPVAYGTSVIYRFTRGAQYNWGLAFYDNNDAYISGMIVGSGAQTIVVPAGAVICRATVDTADDVDVINYNDAIANLQKANIGMAKLNSSSFTSVSGKYVSKYTGNLADAASTVSVIVIPVFSGMQFIYKLHRSPDEIGLAFYDADDAFIVGSGIAANLTDQTITVPDGAAICRVTVTNINQIEFVDIINPMLSTMSDLVSSQTDDPETGDDYAGYYLGIDGIKASENNTDDIARIDTIMDALAQTSVAAQHGSKTIQFSDDGHKKLLVRLHKRTNNNDFDAEDTDVFLPNCRDDFTDVRVVGSDGRVLPYKVVYSGNIDIIPDNNLPSNLTGNIFIDSTGGWIVYRSQTGISRSADDGKTWSTLVTQPLSDVIVTCVTADDVVFFSKSGVLYRSAPPYSTYSTVFDISSRDGAYILSSSMVEYAEDVLFLGTYQTARMIEIYKSTDNGLTWSLCYQDNSGTYQHIHSITVDRHTTPNTIYAGCDGGGGVLKSTDGGTTWTDLRVSHPDMPQSTDYGVTYADENYRLLGGETAIVGGYSIIRTTDDSTFVPIAGTGNGVYMIEKLGGKLFGGGVASQAYRQACILMSEDDGMSWKSVYNTPYFAGDGASDGMRYIVNCGDQIVAGVQVGNVPSLRIFSGNSNRYAQIIVDVPSGIESITVSDGYACGKQKSIYNDSAVESGKIIDLPLNEDAGYVKERISGSIYNGDYSFVNGGKHLANIYPYLTKPSDNKMLSLQSAVNGFRIDGVDLSELSAISFTFWAAIRPGERVIIVKDIANNAVPWLAVLEYALYCNGTNISGAFNSPVTEETVDHYAITIDIANNVLYGYKNSILRSTVTGNTNVSAAMSALKQAESIIVSAGSSAGSAAVQDFAVYNRALTSDEIRDMYFSHLT